MSTNSAPEAIFVRTSERRKWKECRQEWWWEFVDLRKSKDTKPALRFGDLIHQTFGGGELVRVDEAWYRPGRKRGTHPAKLFARIYDEQIAQGLLEFGMYSEDEWTDARDLGVGMLEHYVDTYGTDKHLEVLVPEMTFKVPLLDKRGRQMFGTLNGRRLPIFYVGTLDALVKDHSLAQIGFLEHKTAATISTAHLGLDEQTGSYWAFGPMFLRQQGLLKPDQDINFLLFNFLRKATKDERPQNERGQYLNKPTKDALLNRVTELGLTVAKSTKVDELMDLIREQGEDPLLLGEPSKSQPPPYFLREKVWRGEEDSRQVLYRARAEAFEMDKARNGKLPIYKNPSSAYPDQHCSACQFRDICELHETGSDWEELMRLTTTTWDPYEAHREEQPA